MRAQQGPGRPKALIGYVRVSTEVQGESRVSLDLQRDAIREFADRLGIPLLETLASLDDARRKLALQRNCGNRVGPHLSHGNQSPPEVRLELAFFGQQSVPASLLHPQSSRHERRTTRGQNIGPKDNPCSSSPGGEP